ncbi:MAG: alkaline phosphatase family protein, partial [Devosia sp.]
LADEIVSRFGAAPKSWCSYVQSRDEPHRHEVLANLLQSVDMKQAAGEHYLNQEAWDLFFIGLKEAHCAGHHFWDLSDPTHPDYNAALSGRLGQPLRIIFQRLDQAVGRLVEAAGPDARVLLLATTKMEPNASISHLHRRLGRRLNRAHAENALTQAIRRARRAPPPIEILPYNENGTAIRINRDGARRDRLLADVERSLLELTDARTGQALAERAYHPSADYPGPRANKLPDLLVRYRAGLKPSAITAPRLGRIEAPAPEYRSGNHACGPFAIGAGLDIGDIGSLEDIGAAVTAALGAKSASGL